MVKILDSDQCIAILRGQLNLAERVAPTEELAVTAISVGELAHGAHKSARVAENRARLDVLLTTLTVLPFDERTARRFGALKTDLEPRGHDHQRPGFANCQHRAGEWRAARDT